MWRRGWNCERGIQSKQGKQLSIEKQEKEKTEKRSSTGLDCFCQRSLLALGAGDNCDGEPALGHSREGFVWWWGRMGKVREAQRELRKFSIWKRNG